MKIHPTIILAAPVLAACASEPSNIEFRDIEPVCVEDASQAEDAWTCPETMTIECSEEPPAELYVVRDGDDQSCSEVGYETIEGPFPPGEHDLKVIDRADGEAVCEAELRVVDTEPPLVDPRAVELWPPNHKMVTLSLQECFAEVVECDDDWTASITFVSADEPADASGDGNTEPDIELLGDDTVALRAERSGGGNGRVYAIGYRLRDSSGNEAEGECAVLVPHDRGGRSIDDGPEQLVAPTDEH